MVTEEQRYGPRWLRDDDLVCRFWPELLLLHLSVFFYHTVINVAQAQARCHRIGQLRAVKVYRLITGNTYEREMFDKASLKLGLDKAVLQSMGNKELSMVSGALLLLKQ